MTRYMSTWGTVLANSGGRTPPGRRGLRRIPWIVVRPAGILCLAALLSLAPAHAAAPLPLPQLLDRIGKQVQDFWNYYPAVTCTEALEQSKLNEKGKTLFDQKTTYDYLILLQSTGTDVSVDESRIVKGRKSSKGKASLLLTNGFSILMLLFHPIYQSSYEFTELADDTVDGRRALRIGFRQIPNDRSPSVLRLGDREYPLEWKGTAWVDPSSYAVMRIVTDLGGSMNDIGLLQLNADVTYSGIQFAGTASTYWLPTRAVIEAATKRQRWRNTHLFRDYRRFNVETEVKTATPQ